MLVIGLAIVATPMIAALFVAEVADRWATKLARARAEWDELNRWLDDPFAER